MLNSKTDGVSCEVRENLVIAQKYLGDKKNFVSIPITNHNIKIVRYQYLGRSSPASFGFYVFDPYLIMKVGVPKEVYCIIDYESDALPIRLESFAILTQMIKKY